MATHRRARRSNHATARRLNEVEQSAEHAGVAVATWSPGDGVTRYRFFARRAGQGVHGDYNHGDGAFTALGKKEAMAFLSGVRAARMGRV